MTDCDRLLRVLKDGKSHGHRELYRMGLMVHSRIADLRKKGYEIECTSAGRVNGRTLYEYRLLNVGFDGTLREPEVPPACENSGSRSANPAPLTGTTEALQDGSSPFPSEESASVVPAPQLSLDLPGSTYRKDVAA